MDSGYCTNCGNTTEATTLFQQIIKINGCGEYGVCVFVSRYELYVDASNQNGMSLHPPSPPPPFIRLWEVFSLVHAVIPILFFWKESQKKRAKKKKQLKKKKKEKESLTYRYRSLK